MMLAFRFGLYVPTHFALRWVFGSPH